MSKEPVREVGLTESGRFWAMENLQEIQRLPSINPVNLNYFGAEQCESGYSFGPFVRTSYVLHLIRSGKGRLIKGGRNYEIESGQAFLIYPGEETVYQADRAEPWNYMWVGFHGLQVEEMMDRAGFTKEDPVLTCRNMDKLIDLMDELLRSKDLTYVNELLRTGYLYQLIGLLTINNESTDTEKTREKDLESMYVEMAVNLLINSKNPQVKIGDVAKNIGISRGYLTSLFRKKMGVSPQEFLMNFRMEKAGDLLRSTDNPVGVIAQQLGYTDALSFSKSFHRHYGISPSLYREQEVEVITEIVKGNYKSRHPL